MAMAFQLIQSAQARWGAGTPHLVALVRASATFEKGILVERPPTNHEGIRKTRDRTMVLTTPLTNPPQIRPPPLRTRPQHAVHAVPGRGEPTDALGRRWLALDSS